MQNTTDENELTTVQITKRTSRLLGRLAKAYRRSKAGQVEFMIEAEAGKLVEVEARKFVRGELLPESEDSETEESRA